MILYPQDIFEKLEFDRILHATSQSCLGARGSETVLSLKPGSDISTVVHDLDCTHEYVQSFERNDPVPLMNYLSVEEVVELLKKEGYVLPIEDIRAIYFLVRNYLDLDRYFSDPQRRKLSPRLSKIVAAADTVEENVIEKIDSIIDEEGEVKPDASPGLLKISKSIVSKEKELQSTYSKIIFSLKKDGMLSDTVETLRNGRRVVAVPAENKRKISGIIHDESATGKTVFIEPQGALILNNDLQNLHLEKKKEIYKVLRDLCDFLRPYAESFSSLEEIIVKLDVIRAKARLAITMGAERPEIEDQPLLSMRHAYNPWLKLNYESEGKKVIPFDLELTKGNRVLVVSGPNAGGKSVLMKSIGLLQLMVQSGMLVPADPNSTFGIYKNFLVDIGDQQSMEDDLSTYSSHLQNMKFFSESTDDDTLFLIDEFGSGTDPAFGGAIAEAVLRSLNYKKGWGVITTHYSNLKYYAFKSKGVVNGSMEFDRVGLKPTYRLKVGKPGSSYAYEIASKIGLDDHIIKYAKKRSGTNQNAVEQMLVDLQGDLKETSAKMEKLMHKEDHLNKLIKNYENMHRELEIRRKKLKLAIKERELNDLGNTNKKIQKAVREIREAENIQKLKGMAADFKEKKNETAEEVKKLKKEVYYQKEYDPSLFEVGKYVRMRAGETSGKILSLKNNVARVQMGFMKLDVLLVDLVPAKEPIEINRELSIKTKMVNNEQVHTKLDVRGYTAVDTEKMVEELVDKALINNISKLTIVHGKGSGVLRKIVHKKLKEYKDVKKVYHPEEEFGGDSITYVSL